MLLDLIYVCMYIFCKYFLTDILYLNLIMDFY